MVLRKPLQKLVKAGKTALAENAPARQPMRTRFAPSPTGVMHLGSLRTAVYNYLAARSTGGQFLLRLEDTDQNRLVSGAEENIYETLKWAGLDWDEGPLVGGPHAPYRQSERTKIYQKYVDQLIASGHAYRCFCHLKRLRALSKSARELWPPSTASYDRKCFRLSTEDSEAKAKRKPFIVRFKSPIASDGSQHPDYPIVHDLLHGDVHINPQINQSSVRYDDFTLLKSDGLPTYHLANVVDDHLMNITHVIRGEEWLPSAPKHIALYNALGWEPPKFVHIPLLMGTDGSKLSKRKSDHGVLDKEILPEALVNFVALLGWSPANHRRIGKKHLEVMSMPELIDTFSLDGLTKGSVRVDMSKLKYFDQEHFKRQLRNNFDQLAERCHEALPEYLGFTLEKTKSCMRILDQHLVGIPDFVHKMETLHATVKPAPLDVTAKKMVSLFKTNLENLETDEITRDTAKSLLDLAPYTKKQAFPVLRNVLIGGSSGMSVPEVIQLLGRDGSLKRLDSV